MKARLATTAVFVLAALAASPAAARPVLFVGNVDDGTVTMVDPRALKVIGTFDVTPDGKYLLVSNLQPFNATRNFVPQL